MRTDRGRYVLIILTLLLVLPLLPPGVTAAQETDEEVPPLTVLPSDVTALYFEPTGHNLAGGFLDYWWQHGQVTIFGFPITEEVIENGRTVQYFERARFEYFPEHAGTRYEVQLGHLGRQLAEGRTEPPFQPLGLVSDTPTRAYFDATGHTVGNAFKLFWEDNDGLLNFGYPISEEFAENGRTVQYFERARFEYHPQHAGSPYEVQLGHLGRQLAQRGDLPQTAATPADEAIVWTPGLAVELAVREQQRQVWLAAQPEPVDPFQGVITSSAAYIRRAPTTAAAVQQVTYARHIVRITGVATGEPVDGDDRWYYVPSRGGYISATLVQPFWPPAPPRTWAGRWIDVNLSHFYITAYEGSTPVYTAIITAGRENRTPKGIFYVQRRVRSETMDSRTVGFPPGHPEYYYLPNVEYTQYFTGQGHALHGNYWVHPSRFGVFSSNGCVGMMNVDAAYFWQFATFGTPVHIHF